MKRMLLDHLSAEADEALEALLDHAPIFMVETDAHFSAHKVSAYLAEALGFDRAAMIGQPIGDWLTASSRERAGDTLVPRLLRGDTVEGAELEFVRRNGAVLPVVLSARALGAADQGEQPYLAVMFDNSEARATQAALKAAVAQAEDASRAKSRFLAAMSHEIRTPMNAILGFTQLLKMSELDERRRAHVEAIQSAGGTLMNLLTDLLDLSQIEAGQLRIDAEAFDLDSFLDQLADWWQAGAAEKGLRMRVAKDQGVPAVIISDKSRIQQVLNNYLGNAVKFTKSGRVTLALEEVQNDGPRRRLRFEVSDTGPGLTEDQVDQLFKPFVQVSADYTNDRGGWGLGLSICHEIATAMGGEVGVTSTLGAGSTFFFEVDVDTPTPDTGTKVLPEANTDAAPSDQADRSLQILVAEDNAMSREMMRAMLTELGHSVTTAEDGREAVRELTDRAFDLVFMDVMMPHLDGISAMRRIRRSDSVGAQVPIIACSAHTTDEDSYRKAGMDDFLPKPVDRNRLEALIRRFMPEPEPPRRKAARR